MPSQALTAKGVTTEVAEPIVFLLGAMVMLGDQELAIGLGVLTAAVLAYKQPLPSGLYAVAALAELTDVDDITLSMSEFAQSGEVRMAVIAIVIAALSNTLVKCGMPSCWRALRSASRSPSPRQRP
jgi:uncharacterized membrane protein (DUF4010 family)